MPSLQVAFPEAPANAAALDAVIKRSFFYLSFAFLNGFEANQVIGYKD